MNLFGFLLSNQHHADCDLALLKQFRRGIPATFYKDKVQDRHSIKY